MIYEVKMYSGKCDNCGEDIELGGGDYSAYGDEDMVREEMANSDWHIDDSQKQGPDKHYCPNCFSFGDEDELILNESRKKHF